MPDVQALIRTLPAFAGRRVLLVGEAILDRYLKGRAAGLCREAPVPVVGLESTTEVAGGAANVAVNLARLGADVRFVSTVGGDAPGATLAGLLTDHGVSGDGLLRASDARTLVKHRVRCDDQLIVRFDEGDTSRSQALPARLAEAVRQAAGQSECLVVSDYDLGLMGPEVRAAIAQAHAGGLPLIVDAKCPERYRDMHPDVVKPNFAEALCLLGCRAPGRERAAFIERSREALLQASGAGVVLVTLDAEGAVLIAPDKTYRTSGRAVPAAHTAGAGDTFLSAFTLAYAAHAPLPVAMDLGAQAADLVLDGETTLACGAEALGRELAGQGKLWRDDRQIADQSDFYRARGQRVVFTNGCFDILHRGHIAYLERAKALGDVLVVGLNDDASVRRLKGPGRPINPLADRMAVVAALACVDHVLSFAGDTAHAPIRLIRPHIFAKGGDYATKCLPEAALVEEWHGQVRLLEYMKDASTSDLIARIRREARSGSWTS